MKKIGIYIHIPFCMQKCYYCDFCSYAGKLEMQNKYINSLLKEIDEIKNKNEYQINTIYIGGGTPSVIDAELIQKLIKKINSSFNISNSAEVTIEVNPGTVNEEKIKKYKESGINRISIGLQSAKDELLKVIGRIHNYNDFENAYNIIAESGFSNINVDVMIGLPSQTIEDVEDTINKIIGKNPTHISVYSLIVEPGTIMESMINSGKYKLPDEDVERKMYWLVKHVLEQNGYIQYEISNFAKEGFKSKHNSDCWDQKEYIGLGAAAHSYINATRYSNTSNLEEYIENIEKNQFLKNIQIHEKQDKVDMMKEYMIIGLRKISGINVNSFMQKFKCNPLVIFEEQINKMKNLNLLQVDNNLDNCYIKLTDKGIDFANIVWEEFI